MLPRLQLHDLDVALGAERFDGAEGHAGWHVQLQADERAVGLQHLKGTFDSCRWPWVAPFELKHEFRLAKAGKSFADGYAVSTEVLDGVPELFFTHGSTYSTTRL